MKVLNIVSLLIILISCNNYAGVLNEDSSIEPVTDDYVIQLYMNEQYDSIIHIFEREPYDSDVKLGLYGSSLVFKGYMEKAQEHAKNINKIGLKERFSQNLNRNMIYFFPGNIDKSIGSYELMFYYNYLVQFVSPNVELMVNEVVAKNGDNPFALLSSLAIDYPLNYLEWDKEMTSRTFLYQTRMIDQLKSKYPNWKKIVEFEIYDEEVRNFNKNSHSYNNVLLKIDSLISINYHAQEYKRHKEIFTRLSKSGAKITDDDVTFLAVTYKRLKLM